MREVCTWMNYNVITDTDGFLEKSVLKIEMDRLIESDTLSFPHSSCIPWRNINVILGNDMRSVGKALPCIHNVSESLETLTLFCVPNIQSSQFQDFVTHIILKCQKIHTINVELALLESIVLLPPDKEIVGIRHFRIFTLDKKMRLNYTEVFSQNLEALATRLTVLETFGLGDFAVTARGEDLVQFQLKIVKIVAQNCATLITLELKNSRIWEKTFELSACPILRNFRARAWSKSGLLRLVVFLSNQPMLERLSVSSQTITKELLSVITKNSANLKAFHLKTKNLTEIISPEIRQIFLVLRRPPPHQENPFNFLKDLTALEDFSLTIPKGGTSGNSVAYVGYNIILENLPVMMKKISLRGLNGTGPIDLSGVDSVFPKLSSLCLVRCPGIIDNTGLNYLSTKRPDDSYPLPELVDLRISHCDGVTDIGLTGISDRKGMRSLVLQSCNLSDQCAECLKLRELEFLDVFGNSEFTSVGIHELIQNNPSLKKLKTSVYGISTQGTRLNSIQYKDSQYDDDTDSDATNPRPLPPLPFQPSLRYTASNFGFYSANRFNHSQSRRPRNYHRQYNYDDDVNLSSRDCVDSPESD